MKKCLKKGHDKILKIEKFFKKGFKNSLFSNKRNKTI